MTFEIDEELSNFCQRLCVAYREKEDVYAVKAMFFALLSAFTRQKEFLEKETRLPKTEITRIMEYLCDNLERKITLLSASQKLHIQKSALEKTLKEYTGLTFALFLRNIRISKAIVLLETDKTISEIAYECGFGSLRTFNRIFFATTGRTPTAFRNEKIQPKVEK